MRKKRERRRSRGALRPPRVSPPVGSSPAGETPNAPRAQQASPTSEERYRAIVEDQTELICRFRPDGTLTFVNEAYCRYFGKTREELTGRPFAPRIHPEDQGLVRACLSGLTRDQPVAVVEYRVLLPDGQTRWMRCTNRAFFSDAGPAVELQAVGRDITDRKLVELEREALARFPAENPSPVLRVDCEGRLLYANAASAPLLRQWGVAVGETVPPDWRERVRDALGKGGRQEVDVACEGTTYALAIAPISQAGYANVYGRDITAHVQVQAALREATDHLGVRVRERTAELARSNRALRREMAERQQAQEKVKRERQRLYAVLDTLPAYVVLLSKDYHVPFANRFFRERFGESHGRRCFEYLFQRTEPCENCESYKVLKTNAPHHWEWTGPDGRDYDINDFLFTDTDGSTLILEMGIDVTERKRAEAERMAANKRLQDEIQARIRAEDERLRIEALARGRERLAVLGELAAGVAHELRNPLQGVANYLDLARMKTGRPAELGPLLERIGEGLREMDRLAAQLLDLSRLHTEPTVAASLGPIIETAWNFMKVRADKQRVALACALPPDLPLLQVNPALLAQALLNILKNSVEACPDGGKVAIAAHPHPDRADMVEVLVSDTGPGIPKYIRRRVFDPFFTTKPSGKGMGLGLAMARKVLEACDGYIEVVDTEKPGATIGLGIPIAAGEAQQAGATGAAIV